MRRIPVALGLVALATMTIGCADDAPSALRPSGPAAADISVLFWLLLGLGLAILMIVTAFLLVAGRARTAPVRGPRWLVGSSLSFVVFWAVGVTSVILVVVLVATIWTGTRTYAAPDTDTDNVTVTVVGHKFWWEVRYDDGATVTANEITIPVGRPVSLVLETDDVIHSFWVPELHGKMDMIPGHTNTFWLQADQPGTYRGICAEFCGIQHAQMHFLVHAVDDDEFEAWLDNERADAEPVTDDDAGEAARGQDVYAEANCIACHAVQGHFEQQSEVGPDLTHFASRDSLGAGMQDNTRERLRDWIIDPQASKPGVRMPPTPLDEPDLEALLDYLETLQ